MLYLKNMDSYYGESKVIEGLSLDIPKGKIVSLIGRNGVGKSTTLKSIMGLVKTGPETSLLFDGKEIAGLPAYERVRRGIGYVPLPRA